MVRSSSGGIGAALQASVASSTSTPRVALDLRDHVLADAELLQPLAIDLDRIALLPFLELALRPVLRRVGARVAAVPVGHALDQRRAVAGARLGVGVARRAIDHVGVVAVDDDARQAVGRRAVGGRMLDRRDAADRRVFHVEIVLADEDHRQLPHRGEVQRLVEGADVGGAVAEEADRHVLVALVLRAPGGAAGDRQMRADDGVGAHHAVLGGRQVHRAALAAHQAVVALHQFAQHLLDRHAAGQRVGMAAIGAERQVAGLHRRREAGRHRLLPERQVAGALHQVLQEQVEGALLGLAEFHLHAVHLQPHLLADVVIDALAGTIGRSGWLLAHGRTSKSGPRRDGWRVRPGGN